MANQHGQLHNHQFCIRIIARLTSLNTRRNLLCCSFESFTRYTCYFTGMARTF
jgi:hypothetical protein